MEKIVEENKRRVDVCLAQYIYIPDRLVVLEKAEKERQGILTQIMEIGRLSTM
jgi:hypothetical protein